MKTPLLRSVCSKSVLTSILLVFLGLGTCLIACQVPVFRYALERWPADAYELVCVPAQGGLKPAEEEALKVLQDAARDEEFPANIVIKLDEDGENNSSAARMDLYYPGKLKGFLTKPIWSGEANVENARKVVQSPVRTELIRRILTGESAAWLLVESGNPEKDNAAEQALIEHAKKATGELELPEGVIGKNDTEKLQQLRPGDEENILRSDVPLKIEFSVVRISRLDVAEEVFLQMLLNLEDDLGEYADEPMAFPVFGRGRILEPLIGRGLNYDNVIEHSAYLTGACSCEVKDQNPGIDVLMAMNWDNAMEGSQVIIDKMLPPLEGTAILTQAGGPGAKGSRPTSALVAAEDEGKGAAAARSSAAEGGDSGAGAEGAGAMPMLMPLILIIGAVIVVIGGGTLLLRKNAD